VKVNPQLWWFVARSSGTVAWALCALSVVWGLLLSSRLLGKRPAGPWLLDLHRYLGGLSIVFVAIHLGGLLADSYVHFGPAELFVPFASKWKPLPVAWGIVALYLLAAVEITSLLRKRIPKRVWKRVHAASFGLYASSTVHLLTAGTDAHGALAEAALASVGIVVFLTGYRALTARRTSATSGAVEPRPGPRATPRPRALPVGGPRPASG
jgi:hypothetical protein